MSSQIVGYQTWRYLLFCHWRVDADELQCSLPDELTVQVYDGSAWLAVVPFSMERVRPWWSPSVPGISWFLETNLRTYVRHQNGQTGVWFLSLDANHRLAVQVARTFWHLNYQYARLTLTADGDQLSYAGRRTDRAVNYRLDAIVDASVSAQTATTDTLEHFLLERYHLFSRSRSGVIYTGQVHHEPYTWYPVKELTMQQTLTDWAGCSVADAGQPDHVVYSPGVQVRVSPLQRVTTNGSVVTGP